MADAIDPAAAAFALAPGGAFRMGSDSPRARDDERPPHRVEVAPFWIARTAVTNREYAPYLRATRAPPPPTWGDSRFHDPDQPVVSVSWFDAVAYAEWRSGLEGARYRLPLEAERELACRGGSETDYPWGDDPERALGGYGACWGERPERVGGPPNGFGLFNMADNVHEWCLDWYDSRYYSVSPARNPRGPASGVRRASRGGSWRHAVAVTRSSARSALDPSFRYSDYGFRLVREVG